MYPIASRLCLGRARPDDFVSQAGSRFWARSHYWVCCKGANLWAGEATPGLNMVPPEGAANPAAEQDDSDDDSPPPHQMLEYPEGKELELYHSQIRTTFYKKWKEKRPDILIQIKNRKKSEIDDYLGLHQNLTRGLLIDRQIEIAQWKEGCSFRESLFIFVQKSLKKKKKGSPSVFKVGVQVERSTSGLNPRLPKRGRGIGRPFLIGLIDSFFFSGMPLREQGARKQSGLWWCQNLHLFVSI